MTEMPNPIQLAQLVRLLGAGEVAGASVAGGQARVEGIDLNRLRALVDEGLERMARGLLEEAAASDDVVDVPSAETYLEDRLVFFGELLSEGQRRRLRELFMAVARRWGSGAQPLT
jgi:hypothetical protein